MKPTFLMSLKIWWSMTWRVFLIMVFGLICLTAIFSILAFILSYVADLTSIQGAFHYSIGTPGAIPPDGSLGFIPVVLIVSSVILFYVGIFFIFLCMYRWVFNKIPHIYYKEGRVHLMKNDVHMDHFGLFDTLCFIWSLVWRQLVLLLMFFVVCIFLGILGSLIMVATDSFVALAGVFLAAWIMNFMIPIWAIQWTIAKKQDGRMMKVALHSSK